MNLSFATIRFGLADRDLTRFLGVIAACGMVLQPLAYAGDEPANAFVSGIAKSEKNSPVVMPYSAIVAAAPSDRHLDRTAFEAEPRDEPVASAESDDPKAYAGDDVLAYVGRRATLNGGLSKPVGRIGMRWIQIAGPPIREAFSQGPNLVVVPPEAGVYQFLLVVAEEGRISEPDTVLLTAVEHPEDEAKRKAALSAPPVAPVSAARPVATVSNREIFVRLAAASLNKVPHSPETAKNLAEIFADVSQKMSLYASYAEAHQELSRRITGAIESETTDITAWNRSVFEPLTGALSVWVAPTGMDPANARLWTVPLVEPARSRLAEGLAAIAEGFRGTQPDPLAGKEPRNDGERR